MEWEWKIRITDIIMVFVVIAGPIIAVQLTGYLRQLKDKRDRKVHIFRTLMATRSAQLAPMHVEALNLIDLEFHSPKRQDKRVLDAGRLYMDHLKDREYPREVWLARKSDLLVDLLYEMSESLGYGFDKVQIKAGSYYPSGYGVAEEENEEIRKHWLNIVRGVQQLQMKAEVFPSTPLKPIKQDDNEMAQPKTKEQKRGVDSEN